MPSRVKLVSAVLLYAPILAWTVLLLTLPEGEGPAGWHLDLLGWGVWVALFCVLGSFTALTLTALLGALGKPEDIPRGAIALAVVLANYVLDLHFVVVIFAAAGEASLLGGRWPRLVTEVALWSGFALSLSTLLAGGALGVARMRTEEGHNDWAAVLAALIAALGSLPLIAIAWVAVTGLALN